MLFRPLLLPWTVITLHLALVQVGYDGFGKCFIIDFFWIHRKIPPFLIKDSIAQDGDR